MKKIVLALLILIFVLTPASVAYADVLIEPENRFYEKHRDNIVYLSRGFSANGPDGFAHVRKQPGARNEVTKIKNGEEVYIEYSCLYDGDFWGFTLQNSGWIRMDELLVLYDFLTFEEEHSSEFYAYDGDYAEIEETRSAIAWSWPGSGDALWTFEDTDAEYFNAAYAWKDEQGREWGFVGYLYGLRNIWFCLSDPVNGEIPAFNPASAPSAWAAAKAHKEIVKSDDSMLWIIIILVAVLIIVTAVLIRVFWKPKKQKNENT